MKASILLIMIIGLSLGNSYSQCYFKNTSFKSDEKLKYKGYYQLGLFWIAAGNVEISIKDKRYKGKSMYKIIGTGRSTNSFDSFYRLRDTMYSYIDKESLTPYYYCKITHENKYYSKKTLEYDYGNKKAYYTKKTKHGTWKDTIQMVNSCYTDIISIAYQSRNINFEEIGQGSYITINMIVGNKTYNVKVRYLGYDTISTKRGKKYTCYKLTPYWPESSMFKSGSMIVWLSKDANKIPIMVECKVVIGKVKGIIEGYENFRNPSIM